MYKGPIYVQLVSYMILKLCFLSPEVVGINFLLVQSKKKKIEVLINFGSVFVYPVNIGDNVPNLKIWHSIFSITAKKIFFLGIT